MLKTIQARQARAVHVQVGQIRKLATCEMCKAPVEGEVGEVTKIKTLKVHEFGVNIGIVAQQAENFELRNFDASEEAREALAGRRQTN